MQTFLENFKHSLQSVFIDYQWL